MTVEPGYFKRFGGPRDGCNACYYHKPFRWFLDRALNCIFQSTPWTRLITRHREGGVGLSVGGLRILWSWLSWTWANLWSLVWSLTQFLLLSKTQSLKTRQPSTGWSLVWVHHKMFNRYFDWLRSIKWYISCHDLFYQAGTNSCTWSHSARKQRSICQSDILWCLTWVTEDIYHYKPKIKACSRMNSLS